MDTTIVIEPPPKTTAMTGTSQWIGRRFFHAKTTRPGTSTPKGTRTRTGTRLSASTSLNTAEAVYGRNQNSIADPSSSPPDEEEGDGDEDKEEEEEEDGEGDNPDDSFSSTNGTAPDDFDSDVDDDENEIEAQHDHHHLRRKPFFCTNVPRNEHWKTRMPVTYIPYWLPEKAMLTGVLNTWVTVTHVTHTSTAFWTDDKYLKPPPEPTRSHKHGHHHHSDDTLPTSLHDPYGPPWEGATNSPGGKGLGGGMNNGGGLEPNLVPFPTVTKFSTISTAFVTVTVTETITEAHSLSS
ncbi:hypothetical protein F4678DRAFT_298221 [Xylaria arbuscula]|nr:hypothetical protein F4678DRAFT_298221 [Xylaria arbuscula]